MNDEIETGTETEQREGQALLEIFKHELESLLCSDDVSEEEKRERIRTAQAILDGAISGVKG